MISKNVTDNGSKTGTEQDRGLYPGLLGWAISYAIVSLAVMVGNSLTIAAFSINKKLASARTNYFLVSLGVADFMVGAFSIPLLVAEMLFFDFQEEERFPFKEIYLPIDAFTAFASIFALVAIALDRAYSVLRPHKHKTITKKTYLCEIALVWFVAAGMASLRVIRNFTSKTVLRDAFNYSMMVCIFTSLLLISLAYVMIWLKIRKPVNIHHRNTTVQEKKLAVTLSIITLVFVLTWIPFYIMNLIIMFCHSCYVLHLTYFAKFLQYSNSFANFVIYALKIREFRKTVLKILCSDTRKISLNPKEKKESKDCGTISIRDIQIRLSPSRLAPQNRRTLPNKLACRVRVADSAL